MNRIHIILLVCAWGVLFAQTSTKPSKLSSTKNSVQFEIQQKEELLRRCNRLENDLKILLQQPPEDKEIMQVLTARSELAETTEKLKIANERQALLAEEINTLINSEISQQEQNEYRRCNLVLTEIANMQTKLAARCKTMNQRIGNYLRAIPPPASVTLSCGLKLKLLKRTSDCAPFYISELISKSLAATILSDEATTTPQPEPANLSYFQASELAQKLSKRERTLLILPTQIQLLSMGKQQYTPELAVWSSEPFTTKGSLSRTKGRLGRNQEQQEKLQLTPSQQSAVSRFKIPFYMIWDPKKLLGDFAFIRELPQASHKNLGVVLAAPAQFGLAQRMERISAALKNAPAAED